MLNERRVKHMVKLASYESKRGKEDMKINSYFKKDYVSFNDARNGKLGGDWAAITYPQGENEGKIAGY